jgi:hypothetical protein
MKDRSFVVGAIIGGAVVLARTALIGRWPFLPLRPTSRHLLPGSESSPEKPVFSERM